MRRPAAVLVLALFAAVACTSTSTVASVSSSPAPSPVVTPPTPQASPSTVTDLPLTFPAFVCKLPISTLDTGQAAFIDVGSTGTVTFVQQMTGVHYYDRAFSKWLPVGREAVSADGTHYAYVELTDPGSGAFTIHIVDVATGADHAYRELASSSGLSAPGIGVFDYAPEGIYLTQAFEHVWPDVWLFDPRANTIRHAATIATPQLSANGGFWYGDVSSSDPNPLLTGSSAGILPDEVFRYDVKTGARTRWLYKPGYGLDVIGLDTSGRPLIEVVAPVSNPQPKTDPIDHASAELLLGLDPNDQRTIYKGLLAESLTAPIADAHGVWLGSGQGIYLYSDRDGLEKISNQPGSPANGCA